MNANEPSLTYDDFLRTCSQADEAERRLLGNYALEPERLAPVVTAYLGELGREHKFSRVERLDVLQVGLGDGRSDTPDGPRRLFEDDHRVLVTATRVSDAGENGLQPLKAPASARPSTVGFLVVQDSVQERDLTDNGVPPLTDPDGGSGYGLFRYGFLVTPDAVHVGRQYSCVTGPRCLDPNLWQVDDEVLLELHHDLQRLLLGVRR